MSDATTAALWVAVVGAAITVFGTLIQPWFADRRRRAQVRESIRAGLVAELRRAVPILGTVASKRGNYGILEMSQLDLPIHNTFADFATAFPPDTVTAVLGFTHAVDVTRDAIDYVVARRQNGKLVLAGVAEHAVEALNLALREAAVLQVHEILDLISALRLADERLIRKRRADGSSYFEDPDATIT